MIRMTLGQASMCLFLLGTLSVPAGGISLSYASGDGGASVSAREDFELDDGASLFEETVLDGDRLRQSLQASGRGTNRMTQEVSGKNYLLENRIDGRGSLIVSSSTRASSEGADLTQDMAGTGSTSFALQASHGSDRRGQEASVESGALSSSQGLSAGQGASASQITEMAGLTGRVASGSFSQDEALLAAGSFSGAGSLSARMRSESQGTGSASASVSVDGTEWLKQGDLTGVSSTGTGMAVEGLRLDRLGNIGSFRMQAASLDRAGYEKEERSDRSASGEEASSVVMNLNNPQAYELVGWKWEKDRSIQLHLKDDAYLNAEGLNAEVARNAIAAAANTWDEAVAQNLFADSDLVTITANPSIRANSRDGINLHAWAPVSGGLAYSTTYYYTGYKVDGKYPAIESDVVYNSNENWATEGGDVDVQAVALHELGHTIGLGDLYGKPQYAGDMDQIMHYYTGPRHELGVGDKTGAQELYGAPMSASKYIALRAYSGQYFCAEGGGGREVVANRNAIAAWETFGLIDLGNNNFALQASNGQYLCAEGGGGREVVANRNWAREWETFGLIDLGNSSFALRASNGQYLCAEGGGGREVVANRNRVGGWETLGLLNL